MNRCISFFKILTVVSIIHLCGGKITSVTNFGPDTSGISDSSEAIQQATLVTAHGIHLIKAEPRSTQDGGILNNYESDLKHWKSFGNILSQHLNHLLP